MLDYRQRTIVYRKGTQVRSRHITTGADRLLRAIPVKPWQPMLFSTDNWGSAWATGASVSWRSAAPLSARHARPPARTLCAADDRVVTSAEAE